MVALKESKRWIVKHLVILAVVTPLLTGIDGCSPVKQENKTITLSIHGANALYPLAQVLATKYEEKHPEVRITVIPASSAKGQVDVKLGLADIGMFSGIYRSDSSNQLVYLPIAMDAIVVTINYEHPDLKTILSTGMNRLSLRKVFTSGELKYQGILPGKGYNYTAHVYTRSDASGAANIFAEFLGCNREELQGVGVYGDAGMTSSIRNDIHGIGYDNMGFVFNHETGKKYPGLEVVPIDFDNSGSIEEHENNYEDLNTLKDAIKDGYYPFPLSRTLYFLISPETLNAQAMDFLVWVYTDGIQWIGPSGFIELSDDEMNNYLLLLNHLNETSE
jgi:phosphate transport system substrate-binding protein